MVRGTTVVPSAALGLAAVWCGPGLAAHWPALARALALPRRLQPASGVALTFDDGPHPEGTPAVLGALERAEAIATFFLVGEQVERYPWLAAEIVAAGHEPAVHGYRHRNQMRVGPRSLAADLRRSVEVIGDACGRAPRLYRPPYGAFSPVGLALVRRMSLEPLLWSEWGRDWRADTSADEIAALATGGLTPGSVILLHDADWYSSPGSHRRTAAALPAILAELERRGLQPTAAGRRWM